MMEGVIGKVMAGWMSLTALMFSPYSGNEPAFRALHLRAGESYVILQAKLDKAFDNDFLDVFNCGKPVTVNFKIEVRNGNRTEHSSTYRHTVTYDPMNAVWELVKSGTRQRDIITTYQKLLAEVSLLECSIPRDANWKHVEFRVEAWLQPVQLSQPDKTVDLMVLWKFRRPAIKSAFNLQPTS
jgi:hypothetical protein